LAWLGLEQGDQIGRIFAYWVVVFFCNFSNVAEISQISESLFSSENSYALILTKMDWATFGRYFNKLIWSPWFGGSRSQKRFGIHFQFEAGKDSPKSSWHDSWNEIQASAKKSKCGVALWPSRPPQETKISGSNPARVLGFRSLYVAKMS
jgi:hypothetical protein